MHILIRMSGLSLLAGYGSASDDEEEINAPAADLEKNISILPIMIPVTEIKTIKLPSAMDLLGCGLGVKRKAVGEVPSLHNASSKIIRTVTKAFIPPQIKSDRPNVVTEDTKHRQ